MARKYGGLVNPLPRKKADDPKLAYRMRHIKQLSEIASQVDCSPPVLEYGAHTLLKVICVSSYSFGFCSIVHGDKARSQGYDGAIYLDLFAGPGVVKISDNGVNGDFVAGSPLAVSSHKKFDYSIFIEKAPRSSAILERRLGSMLEKEKFRVVPGDCNEKIGEVVDDVNKRYSRPIVLAFVDPEGMEIKFETLRKLSASFRNVDFMINLNAGTERVAGQIAVGEPQSIPIFNDFFEGLAPKILVELALGATSTERVEERYARMVREVLGRTIGNIIPIYAKGAVLKYSILSYTRASSTGSQWVRIWEHIAKMLDGVDGEDARRTLDIVKNRGDGFLDKWSST